MLLTSHEDEAAAAHSNNSKGTKLATIVPCNPLHPLGAFMHDGKVTTDSVNIEDADYTHRVLSRWVMESTNHHQVLELAGNVGVKPGKDQRTHQRVNYANMVASDQRTSRPVNGARVYADAWVFPVATLTSITRQYRSALVFCPVPPADHATSPSYRESVAWATYTAMYACAQLGIDVVVLASLHADHAGDVRTMLRGGRLPDGSSVPELGSHFAKVIVCVGPSSHSSGPSSGPSSSGPSSSGPSSSGPSSSGPSSSGPSSSGPKLKTMGILGDPGPSVRIDHVVVDPAGLEFIQKNTPWKAGALSKVVYKFLGISAFPQGVRGTITKTGHAAHHKYTRPSGEKTDVIHVVGPNFEKRSDIMWHDAVRNLKEAYASVIRVAEGLPRDLRVIRIPVISGGLFAGKFGESGCVPELTARAVLAAFAEHGGGLKKEYWLCTYSDVAGMRRYERAFALAGSVRHHDYKGGRPSGAPGHHITGRVVREVNHEYGAVGYAAEISGVGNKVGVMVAGNSARPAGAIGDPLACIPTISHETVAKGFKGRLPTQEESVVSEWMHGEHPGDGKEQEQERERLFRSTICGLWGQKARQSHKTIQGVNYMSADRAAAYADAWVVRDAKLRHRDFGARASVSATLVFVAGPNANKTPAPSDPNDYGSMWATANARANRDYAFFRLCVKESVRAGLLAMQAEGVTHALVARVSCQLYAGPHRAAINRGFVGLVQEAANEIAYDAAIVVVGIQKSAPRTHYGVAKSTKARETRASMR